MFCMAVILFSCIKGTETAAFFCSVLRISAVFLCVLVIGYLNVRSLNMKEAFADRMEEAWENDRMTEHPETGLYELRSFSDEKNSRIRGRITKFSVKGNHYMTWLSVSEIDADTETGIQSYRGNMDMIAYLPAEADIKPGQSVVLSGILKRPDAAADPGAFDARSYYENQGIFFILYSAEILEQKSGYNRVSAGLMKLKEKLAGLYESILSPRYASVVNAMLLGEKDGLDEETKSMYQMTGMAHILAISGVHIAVLGLGLFRFFRKTIGSYGLSGGFTFGIVLLYGMMTGMSGSTRRAVIMTGILLLGKILGRTADLLTSLGFACMLMLLLNPCIIRDAGFQLSFLAIMGLGGICPVLSELLGQGGRIRQAFYAGFSVNAAIMPVIIYNYYEWPLYSVLLNLAVVPLVSVILSAGLLAGIVGMFSVPVAGICAIPATAVLQCYDFLGRICTKLPCSSIHIGHISPIMAGLYYIALIFILVILLQIKKGKKRKGRWILLFAVLLAAALFEYRHLDRGFLVAFLSVGQGDCILVRTDSGINIMIDGGSMDEEEAGRYLITPALKYFAMQELDYVLVSHGDQDHISGILYFLQTEYTGIRIKTIVIPQYGDRDAFSGLIAAAEEKGVEVLYADQGFSMVMQDFQLSCLYPDAGVTLQDTNALSGVWKLATQEISILFPGDLDEAGERYLLNEKADISCDILKVGHHGSKSSSGSDFLEACHMDMAVISCGKNNRYGHPHAETLDRLGKTGAKVWRTDINGAVIVREKNGMIQTDTCFK